VAAPNENQDNDNGKPDRTEAIVIHAENLRLQYPTKSEPALDGVSFQAAEGEVLGVVGPTESGKTSLAQAVAGFAPSVTGGTLDGELTVAGRDPREADDARVGMVFEDYSSQLTQVHVRDEIAVPLLSQGYGREAAREKVHELLDRVRLPGYGDKRTWELSGGEQQRVAIAAALALDPDVLVFDTATDMLDPDGREDVWNLISSLKGDTTLVVTVTDPRDLVGVADRVLVIENGTPAAFGSVDETIRNYELLEDVGITPPTCLRVAETLGLSANPLTPSEFADALASDGRERTGMAEPAATAADGGMVVDTGEPVLCVENVTFGYSDDETAIESLNLNVHEGEVHALIGGNGAGKSTLSELLVGLLEPDEGRILVDGETTDDKTVGTVSESIALSFQNPDEQLSKRTVEKEIRFPLEERRYESTGWFSKRERYDEEYIDERVETACELAGLDDEREADPTFLPQGGRRLAAIASAVAPDPSVAILDEPTAGLDTDGTERIRKTIEQLRADGKAVVLIGHDMGFVCEVADRVTLLGDGETILRGTPKEVFAHENWDTLHEQYVRPPRAACLADRIGVNALTAGKLVEVARPLAEVSR
jgi:energy-coupling factor transporter ATP-binding protein EcfA2